MDKEKIIDKLEKVFEVATDNFIRTRGGTGNLKEIKELGSEIIHLKRNIQEDTRKMETYIDRKIKMQLDKNMHITAKEMAAAISSELREI